MPSQTVTDVVGSIHAFPVMWRWLIEAVGPDVVEQASPSCGNHLGDGVTALGKAAGREAPATGPLAQRLDDLARLAPFAAAAIHQADDADAAQALLDRLTASFHAAGRAIHCAGAGVATQRGVITQVSVSHGGVPKTAVDRARVGPRGLVDDRQAARRHHGKPMQALCLYSQDVIDALRHEGHPIVAGAAGENVTVQGIDWPSLRPGVRLGLGEVLVEISAAATPCDKNARWFLAGDYDRMDQGLHPGWSRLYAWVLEAGEIAPGDTVVVEP